MYNNQAKTFEQFQSTHPLGVRLGSWSMLRVLRSFNPRTHSGCDILNIIQKTRNRSFNPRTHSGCDLKEQSLAIYVFQFQSTHPLGVRLLFSLLSMRYCSFNPRTHSGCDSSMPVLFQPWHKFQSTHPLGVRPRVLANMAGR